MGHKAVTINQNDQDVLVGWVSEEADSIEGGTLHPMVFESQACEAPGKDVKDLISKNSGRSFDLHKVVDGKIVCRSVGELQASEWIDWNHNWKPEEVEEDNVDEIAEIVEDVIEEISGESE